MVIVSVIYPKTETSHFDVDYYVKTHMPLVHSRWSNLGLQKAELFAGKSSLEGGAPAYAMIAQLTFPSEQHVKEALAKGGEEILADIPNFTDVQPSLQLNNPL